MLFIIFNHLFLFQRYWRFLNCKLAKSWRHTLNQIVIKYDEKKISEQRNQIQFT